MILLPNVYLKKKEEIEFNTFTIAFSQNDVYDH